MGVLEKGSTTASFSSGLPSLGETTWQHGAPATSDVSLMSHSLSSAWVVWGSARVQILLRICGANSLLSDHAFFRWPLPTLALVNVSWEEGLGTPVELHHLRALADLV